VGGANNCTTCKNPTLADLVVFSIYQQQQVDGCCLVQALVYKHTHLTFYPLLNWKPVQVDNCGSNAVILPLA